MLNQSYEPMTICNLKKAFILLFLNKAELVEDQAGKTVRSVNSTFKWPSVIRLKNYVKTPYRKIIFSRKNILKRDNHRCAYCGRGDKPLTIDHIIPKSRGGEETWENLIAACTKCNNKKGDRTPAEANMPLLRKAFKPTHVAIIKNASNRLDENWKPYLFQ